MPPVASHKPVILWTADCKGWAYANRVRLLRQALPQYDHHILIGDYVPQCLWGYAANLADIVVCQGVDSLGYFRGAFPAVDQRKMVLRIDSIRIVAADGTYVDVFKFNRGKT